MSNNDPTPNRPDHRPAPTQRPDQTPKPRGRKKGQKGPVKTPRRGMGVEKLELLSRKLSCSSTSTLTPTNNININNNMTNNNMINNNLYPYNVISPLAGIPVHQYQVALTPYRFPGQPGPDPRSYQRIMPAVSDVTAAGSAPAAFSAAELPSMPNLMQLQEGSYIHQTIPSTTLFSKKKRVIGEQEEGAVGFSRGKEKYADHQSLPPHYGCNLGGFDINNNNNNGENYQYFGGFPVYASGSEVVAIHRKWSGSNVMMEYGFFPGRSEVNGVENINRDHDNSNNNNNNNNYVNYYYKTMEDLDLKMGCSESSSPSSSSSLASLTTATTTTTSNSSIDLSLKLSSY